jgi:colanic acid/amylovoran biosynthesis glycosyltransferase
MYQLLPTTKAPERRAKSSTHSSRLAVFTSQIGGSFINRHIDDLLPNRTVAVSRYREIARDGGFWKPTCSVFFLDQWRSSLPVRLTRRLGVSEVHLRDTAVKRFLRRHRVTVVLGEFLDQFVDFVPLLDQMRLPYIVQGHGIDVSAALRIPGMAERYLAYKSARVILTRCEFHRKRLIELGLPASKISVNPGGVDVPAQQPRRPPEAYKRFLAIGAMIPKKGPIYLLEAFRLAAAQDRDVTLDFVGGGPLFPAVRQFVDACGLSHRVRVHGVTSEETKVRLLQECGVFVQHSLTNPETGDEEGLPAAIQEAMAHGMAVVSTRHSGIPEAVEDGVTGWLVEEGDTEQMAIAMIRATSSAPLLGNAGYLQATMRHSWLSEKNRLMHWIEDAMPGTHG